MIRSKTNTFSSWVTRVLLILFPILFVAGLRMTGEDKKATLIFSSFFFVVNLPHLWQMSRQIKINAAERTIAVTQFFTRKRIIYHFADIDGYVDMMEERARGGPYKVVYLVKDEKFIQRISSTTYSNVDEMEEGLKASKYLGSQDFSWLKRIKIIFGRKVLNTSALY